jgi:hypothetical protein
MQRQSLLVRLGNGWSMFAQLRDGVRLLGTVQDGMQIGALGQMPDGGYAQVNGDVVRKLNASRVEHALDRATGTRRGAMAPRPPPSRPDDRPQPTVIVKKRRKIVLGAETP